VAGVVEPDIALPGVRYRRVLLIAVRRGEGRLAQPTAAARPWGWTTNSTSQPVDKVGKARRFNRTTPTSRPSSLCWGSSPCDRATARP